MDSSTGYTYDPLENKFFNSKWEPEYEEDKEVLQKMIDDNKDYFKGCIIIEV